MDKKKKIIGLVLIISMIAGCASMGEKAKTGTATGAVLGGIAGGVIGHQSGEGLAGAAIGAATGAIAGGLIGDKMDKARRTNPNHLRLTEIADMSTKGLPDSYLIDEIKRTDSVYYLNSELITYLKKEGVSDKVIDYMISTGYEKSK